MLLHVVGYLHCCTSVVLDLLKQLVIQPFKKFLLLLNLHVSPTGTSQPATGPYPEPVHTFPDFS